MEVVRSCLEKPVYPYTWTNTRSPTRCHFSLTTIRSPPHLNLPTPSSCLIFRTHVHSGLVQVLVGQNLQRSPNCWSPECWKLERSLRSLRGQLRTRKYYWAAQWMILPQCCPAEQTMTKPRWSYLLKRLPAPSLEGEHIRQSPILPPLKLGKVVEMLKMLLHSPTIARPWD